MVCCSRCNRLEWTFWDDVDISNASCSMVPQDYCGRTKRKSLFQTLVTIAVLCRRGRGWKCQPSTGGGPVIGLCCIAIANTFCPQWPFPDATTKPTQGFPALQPVPAPHPINLVAASPSDRPRSPGLRHRRLQATATSSLTFPFIPSFIGPATATCDRFCTYWVMWPTSIPLYRYHGRQVTLG